MTDLLKDLNVIRDETISKHYNAAFCELKDKILNEPLKTKFLIYSGCVSKEVADELAFRLNKQGLKATVFYTLMRNIYLEVEVLLPENLVHKEEISKAEEKVPEETPK
jgi:hypothetical protein